MPKIDVNGVGIAYELIGGGPKAAAITSGGRFSKDTPGLRELAVALAADGYRTVIWDRPNCGESDVCFEGESESILNADTLAGLLKALDLAPALLIGGSAGSRVTLLTVTRHPEVASAAFLLWISGGNVGLAALATHYCMDNAFAACTADMAAVADLPSWTEQVTRNPGNRARILAQDRVTFLATMQRWAASYFPTSGSPVPGLTPERLAAINIPVVVLRSGPTDIHHTRQASEELAALVKGAQLKEPPWGENEWNEAGRRPDHSLFRSWPMLAPQIVELGRTTQ